MQYSECESDGVTVDKSLHFLGIVYWYMEHFDQYFCDVYLCLMQSAVLYVSRCLLFFWSDFGEQKNKMKDRQRKECSDLWSSLWQHGNEMVQPDAFPVPVNYLLWSLPSALRREWRMCPKRWRELSTQYYRHRESFLKYFFSARTSMNERFRVVVPVF